MFCTVIAQTKLFITLSVIFFADDETIEIFLTFEFNLNILFTCIYFLSNTSHPVSVPVFC